MYVDEVDNKTADPNAKPVVLKESPATAWVDGNNGLGPVVGNFCMQLAIEKAKSVGVGWVVAKRKLADHTGQSRMMYVLYNVL
jgi:LDH2 family malate/lactate/ureidoglycolate dehydrogenase